VKRLTLLLVTAAVASFSAACGGSGTPPPPPAPTGNFSNSSLKGSYAFSMSGTDASTNVGAFLTRVGSFTADGAGNITAAMEDISDGASVTSVPFSGGSYSIQANGKGTLTFTTINSSGLQLTIVLNSSSKGVLIQTDLNATSSGSFILQSPNTFAQGTINGPYNFDVSGMDGNSGAPVSVVGQITTNGAGAITGGIYDSDDGGSLITAQAIPTGGSYTAPDTTFGRGTMTFASRNFVYYLVDGTRVRLIETDGLLFTSGDALLQTNVPTVNTAGNFVFIIGGSSVLGTAGPVARGGRFTTDASGNLGSISVDDNNNGSASTTTSFTNANFAIDTANPGTGRGTVTFTAQGQQNPFTAVFYFSSPTQAVIQDTSVGIIGDGTMLAQIGPFNSSAGNYIVNWSGQNLALGFEEDFAGQYALSSSNAVSGAIDFVELASPSNRNPLFSNIQLTGNFGLNGDGTQRNTYVLTTNSAPNTTYNSAAYIGGTAAAPTILLIDVDPHHVDVGTTSLQTQ
jgi:hypothetical protein